MLARLRWVRLRGGAEAAAVALTQVRALAAAIRVWVCRPRLKPRGQGAAGAEGGLGGCGWGSPGTAPIWLGTELGVGVCEEAPGILGGS